MVAVGSSRGDALSIELRNFGNLYLRIPNESVMKSSVVDDTRFPIRRRDLKLFVDADVGLDAAEGVLPSLTERPLCLEEPVPIVIRLGISDAGEGVRLSAWALRDNFLAMRNQLHRDVAHQVEASRIPFGFPKRMVDVSSAASTQSAPPSPTAPL